MRSKRKIALIEQTSEDDNEKSDSVSAHDPMSVENNKITGPQPPFKRPKIDHFTDNNIYEDDFEPLDIFESDPSALLLTLNQESTEKEIRVELSLSDQSPRNISNFGYRKVFFPYHQDVRVPISFIEQDAIVSFDMTMSLKKSDSFIFNIEEDNQPSNNLDVEIEENFEFKIDPNF